MAKDPAGISQEQTFYQNLYSEKINLDDPNYQLALNEFLQNNEIIKLTNDEREFCERSVRVAICLCNVSYCRYLFMQCQLL